MAAVLSLSWAMDGVISSAILKNVNGTRAIV